MPFALKHFVISIHLLGLQARMSSMTMIQWYAFHKVEFSLKRSSYQFLQTKNDQNWPQKKNKRTNKKSLRTLHLFLFQNKTLHWNILVTSFHLFGPAILEELNSELLHVNIPEELEWAIVYISSQQDIKLSLQGR